MEVHNLAMEKQNVAMEVLMEMWRVGTIVQRVAMISGNNGDEL